MLIECIARKCRPCLIGCEGESREVAAIAATGGGDMIVFAARGIESGYEAGVTRPEVKLG